MYIVAIRASPTVAVTGAVSKKVTSLARGGGAQIDAPTDAATGAVKLGAGQKRYLVHYIYRTGWSARHKLRAGTTTHFYSLNI
jgi:hypothetical protein